MQKSLHGTRTTTTTYVLSSKRMGNSFFLSPKEMPPAKVLPPKVPAKLNLQDGTFHRPAGRAPKGYQWDASKGAWTWKHPGQDLNDDREDEEEEEEDDDDDDDDYYSTVSNEYHTPNEEMSNNASFLPKKKMHPSPKTEDDDVLLPKIPPKRNQQDGSWHRPAGRAPKGFQWDARMGLWTLEQPDKYCTAAAAAAQLRQQASSKIHPWTTSSGIRKRRNRTRHRAAKLGSPPPLLLQPA